MAIATKKPRFIFTADEALAAHLRAETERTGMSLSEYIRRKILPPRKVDSPAMERRDLLTR